MEAEKKKTDYWQVVFSATGVGVMPAMIKQIREILPFAINGTAIAAFTGAIGALLGFGIYSLVKNRKVIFKIIAYIFLLAIIVCGTTLMTKFSSDSYIVKREWNVIKEGNLTFEYPNRFSEISLGEKPENAEKISYFSDKKNDRYAMYLIFDFNQEPPAPEDSLSGAIINSLSTIKATDIEWIDPEFYEDAVTTKVKYKAGRGERLGFGIIYFKDWHYEVALFLPATKDFSEEFLNKVIESIAVEE